MVADHCGGRRLRAGVSDSLLDGRVGECGRFVLGRYSTGEETRAAVVRFWIFSGLHIFGKL